MSITELARVFNARGHGKRIRARCPVHAGKSLTLALYDDGDGLSVHCFAGCSRDDVLAAVGLTWKDLRPLKEWMQPKEYAALLKQREAEEERARNLRIGKWILRFSERGYTRENRLADVSNALAACALLEVKSMPHREMMLQTAMERIEASNHCMERRMLPPVAPPRKEWNL
jgi:hypothetical protein